VTTDLLIARLVSEAGPVRRLVDPRQRASLWTAAALVCTFLGVLHFGVRRDFDAAIRGVELWLRLALLTSTLWLAISASFRMSVPGRETRVWRRWWPLVALGALVAVVAGDVAATALAGTHRGSPMRAWTCLRKVSLVGAFPAALAVLLIGRARTLEPQWAATLGIVAAAAAGGLTAELACPIRAPLHILLWHALPVVAGIAVGLAAGTALLTWMRRT
jgi:hypothetical protein